MNFWHENVDRIIQFNDKPVLDHKGTISHAQMEELVGEVYDKFNARRKSLDAQKADEDEMEELQQIAQNLKPAEPKE